MHFLPGLGSVEHCVTANLALLSAEDMAKPVGDMSSQYPLLTDDPLMMDKCIVSQLHQLHQRCHR